MIESGGLRAARFRSEDWLTVTIEDIQARRSVSPRRLVEPGPDQKQIATLIRAACSAPDHCRLRPWRFILIRQASRARLADLFKAAAIEMYGDLTEDAAERAREKAAHGPCLIAIVAHIRDDMPDVPAYEQWVSVGAAMQNILLAATSLGFSSMIVSGNKVRTHRLRDGLGLYTAERLLGFVSIGTPSKGPRRANRPMVDEVLTVW